jgi:hypothetical protein
MGRLRIASIGVAGALALAFSGCGSSSGPLNTSPNGYLMSASDGSWYVFIEVQNGVGTADSVAYSSAANQVAVNHGSVTLSNGLIDFTGIANISFFSGGCNCQYQLTGNNLIVSIPTTSGLQQASFQPADVAQYNADVQALNAEQQQSAAAASASASAAAAASASASRLGQAQALALLLADIPSGGPSLSQISDGTMSGQPNSAQIGFASASNTYRIEDDVVLDASIQSAGVDYPQLRDAARQQVAQLSLLSSPNSLGHPANEYIGRNSAGYSEIAITFQHGPVICVILFVDSSGTVGQGFAIAVAFNQYQKILNAVG